MNIIVILSMPHCSLNEDNTTVADNTVTVTVAVETQANIFVDQG